jgi:hypothetical protein
MRLDQVILRGTHAARPAAATLPNGSLYGETDTNEVYEVVAAAWALFVDGDGGSGGSGTVTSITAGVGLDGGEITVAGTIDLADTAVTPGTYGDDTHVAQVTIDQQGRITAASEVAITGGGGGGPPQTLIDLALLANDWLAPALQNGNFTVGNAFRAVRAGVEIDKIRFYWSGGAGALQVDVKLRTNGSITTPSGNYGTTIDTVANVAVNAAGVYEAVLAAPVTLTQNQWYCVDVYEDTGTKYLAMPSFSAWRLGAQGLTTNWIIDPAGIQYYESLFAVGAGTPAPDDGSTSFAAVNPHISA